MASWDSPLESSEDESEEETHDYPGVQIDVGQYHGTCAVCHRKKFNFGVQNDHPHTVCLFLANERFNAKERPYVFDPPYFPADAEQNIPHFFATRFGDKYSVRVAWVQSTSFSCHNTRSCLIIEQNTGIYVKSAAMRA